MSASQPMRSFTVTGTSAAPRPARLGPPAPASGGSFSSARARSRPRDLRRGTAHVDVDKIKGHFAARSANKARRLGHHVRLRAEQLHAVRRVPAPAGHQPRAFFVAHGQSLGAHHLADGAYRAVVRRTGGAWSYPSRPPWAPKRALCQVNRPNCIDQPTVVYLKAALREYAEPSGTIRAISLVIVP